MIRGLAATSLNLTPAAKIRWVSFGQGLQPTALCHEGECHPWPLWGQEPCSSCSGVAFTLLDWGLNSQRNRLFSPPPEHFQSSERQSSSAPGGSISNPEVPQVWFKGCRWSCPAPPPLALIPSAPRLTSCLTSCHLISPAWSSRSNFRVALQVEG